MKRIFSMFWIMGSISCAMEQLSNNTTPWKEGTTSAVNHQAYIDPRTFLDIDQIDASQAQPVKVALIDYNFDYHDKDILGKLSLSYRRCVASLSAHAIQEHRQLLRQDSISSHGTMMAHLLTGSHGLVENVILCPIAIDLHKSLVKSCQIALNTKADFVSISLPLHHGHEYPMEDELQGMLEKLAQNGVGVIVSAGNHAIRMGDTPYSKTLAELAQRMTGHMLLVGGTSYIIGKGGIYIERMDDRSNRAGDAWRDFITAPASIAKVYGIDGQEKTNVFGTSYGAPIVMAIAVILKGLYPSFSNQHILKIIRLSGRKCFYEHKGLDMPLGPELDADVYGHGMVDLPHALSLARKFYRDKKAPDDL